MLSGHACVQDVEGNRYEGNFFNWQKHGKGRIQTLTGEQYEGEWVNGVRQGFGTLIRPDGSRFQGMFDRSEYDGCLDSFFLVSYMYRQQMQFLSVGSNFFHRFPVMRTILNR